LIEWHSEQFTNSECKRIKDKFFDDVKFHEWAVREYKKKKANGLQMSFADFLAQNQSAPKIENQTVKPVREKRASASKPDESALGIETEAPNKLNAILTR
jgi:hypothetical protein